MGAFLLFFWSILGLSLSNWASFGRMKGIFCAQREEGGLEHWPFMYFLYYLEGKKQNCF